MRWFAQWPVQDQVRVRSRFLVLPKRINREWRWFERARWEECCLVSFVDPAVHWWEPSRWL